jgi:mannose-6-phosphate isomerase-like protein (cupin superfamily)
VRDRDVVDRRHAGTFAQFASTRTFGAFESRAERIVVGVRRVVTGHTEEGKAIVVSDEDVDLMPIGDGGSAAMLLWGRDGTATFPDDGSRPDMAAPFPSLGGCGLSVMQIAPGSDDVHAFIKDALAPWADPNEPGMHRTATLDYDIVLEGRIGLELDDGAEVELGPGDVVVQNGTRHRWHNRGDTVARFLSVTVGATNHLEGGGPT